MKTQFTSSLFGDVARRRLELRGNCKSENAVYTYSVGQKLNFLAPSQDLRKVAISFVPSVCTKQLGSDWADFRDFLQKKNLPRCNSSEIKISIK
jgi:hypothetical protein